MTDLPYAIDHTVESLVAKATQRANDMVEAAKAGQHFWEVFLIHRITDPMAPLILDTENLCGMVPIHCAICGTDDASIPCITLQG